MSDSPSGVHVYGTLSPSSSFMRVGASKASFRLSGDHATGPKLSPVCPMTFRRAPVGRAVASRSSHSGLSRRTWPTNPEGVGTHLSHRDERSHTGHVTGESHLSELGHSLYRQTGLCAASSCRVAREDQRTRGAPAGGSVLPTTGCIASGAPGSAQRSARREQETEGLETAL